MPKITARQLGSADEMAGADASRFNAELCAIYHDKPFDEVNDMDATEFVPLLQEVNTYLAEFQPVLRGSTFTLIEAVVVGRFPPLSAVTIPERFKVKDLFTGLPAGYARSRRLMAQLTGITEEQVDAMDARDYLAIRNSLPA